jgi:hypothetical protein
LILAKSQILAKISVFSPALVALLHLEYPLLAAVTNKLVGFPTAQLAISYPQIRPFRIYSTSQLYEYRRQQTGELFDPTESTRKEEPKMEAIANRITAPLTKGGFERRFHQRFEANSGAIASTQLDVVGQIVNISETGLEFRYVASRERSKESTVLSIELTDHTFSLDQLPFKVAWDVAMPQGFSIGPISLRYCGVEFGNLADDQRRALRYFIQNHTTVDFET